MALVLDTCTWLWYCSEPEKPSDPTSEAIGREKQRDGLVLSVISCWEIAKLVKKRKLSFTISCKHWIERALEAPGITLYPLTAEICVESSELPGRFHADPADQIIVATARSLSCAVVTKDRRILSYAHVPAIW
jgi:PIN domain nuclease of toxin-antitoxin system